ncbi:hypothetical protein K504DRAFT_458783 [Pleomassaria siparia CBS 279.74]|uniref:mRNA 3'-end-processing protein RNA14 n=1 Tax=Pleomassaria siparia CBS 279.74 TaxID=1314801 RepID=A0A6G1K4G9_9PLEO|nr:hypothetical protein K504DRAFT_458783 [Pleomassaria siparia CBS 279.74]
MADVDPELAFLESQKAYNPAGDYSNMGAAGSADDDEEEYDPAFPSYPAQDTHSPSDQSASMPPDSAPNTPPTALDGAALKPQPADVDAPAPSKQPRTMGGFVVESEDEEDEEPVVRPVAAGSELLNAPGVSESPQRSLTHTPNTIHPPQTVPLHSAQDQGNSGASSSTLVAVNDTAPILASAVPNGGTSAPDATKPGAPEMLSVEPAKQAAAPITQTAASSLPKARLAQDRVGILEDRIAEDPRGDTEAWLSLIEEHRRRHKYDEARAVYDRFFKVFPSAAEQWVEYVNMESDLDDFIRIEKIFERSILSSPHVALWTTYVNYIRRRNPVNQDPGSQARQIITTVYEFVLDNVGIDFHSGKIWLEYIEFIKSGPGVLGGSSWQDMQKMDTVRKAFQRAIAVPNGATLEIWREYDRFELGLNKATGRKYLQEKSSSYMTARSAVNVLENITKGVIRTSLPKLPPVQGFDGYDQYMTQVGLWKNWLQWEKDDPLMAKDDDRALYNKRVIYLYKNALMALRFWPELWYEAAEWCFQNELEKEGNEFLTQGIEANPESCLLAFRKAHQVELTFEVEDGEGALFRKGEAVRAPFNTVLDALYELTNQTKKREDHTIARVKENFAAQQAAEEAARELERNSDDAYAGYEDEDADEDAKRLKQKEEGLKVQLQAISAGYNAQVQTLKRTISYAWIALMRTMRRIQGKGRPDAPAGTPPGFRGIFAEARKRGKLLSDTYVASALIEHHSYQDPAATKIFDRGMRLFPDDEQFALEYIKHLVKQNDATNARAVFEKMVDRLTQNPENVARAKPLFIFFHGYESQFGELAQIVKLEKRMSDLFPEDPLLLRFAQRFSTTSFDPTTIRPIVSPKAQMRPVMLNVMPTVEEAPVPLPAQVQELRAVSPPGPIHSPHLAPALLPISHSPKRPFEEVDNELSQPRKMLRSERGESPLKGAAGRRLDAARRNQVQSSGGVNNMPVMSMPQPLPREVNFLLGIIPGAQAYRETRFSAEKMVALLQNVDFARAQVQQPQMQQPIQAPPPQQMGWGHPQQQQHSMQQQQQQQGYYR